MNNNGAKPYNGNLVKVGNITMNANLSIKQRYSLEIPLCIGNADDVLVVILQNPSYANTTMSDQTINNVIDYVCDNDNRNNFSVLKNIGKIVILNLIPVYETIPTNLPVSYFSSNASNIAEINTITKVNVNVIVAWGEQIPSGTAIDYCKLISDTLKILQNNNCDIYHVGDLTKKLGCPKHAARNIWGTTGNYQKLNKAKIISEKNGNLTMQKIGVAI